MPTIRVDPGRLHKAASDIASVAEELRTAGSQLHQVAQGAPSYDGQFGPQVASFGLEADSRSRALTNRLAELSTRLAAKAEAFESVDAAALQGLASIQRDLLAWVHSQGEFPLAPLLIPIDWGDESPTLAEQLEALITQPPWVVARERPPWIPPDVWHHMDREDRGAVLRDVNASLQRFLSLYRNYMADGRIPDLWVVAALGMNVRVEPNVSADKVRDGLENRDTVSWDGKARWGEDGRLWFHVSYNVGSKAMEGWVAAWEWGKRGGETNLAPLLPAGDGGGFAPAAATHGYGEGWSGWAGYYTEPLPSQPQYLDVREILRVAGFEDWQEFPTAHHNLCGQLAVFEATGVSLEEGIKSFLTTEGARATLLDDAQTGSGNLVSLFHELGWSGAVAESVPKFEDFASDFSPTGETTALITINKVTGLPEAPDPTRPQTGHWVNILSLDRSSVTIYNPLTNRAEPYALADFEQAWNGTVINSGPPPAHPTGDPATD